MKVYNVELYFKMLKSKLMLVEGINKADAMVNAISQLTKQQQNEVTRIMVNRF